MATQVNEDTPVADSSADQPISGYGTLEDDEHLNANATSEDSYSVQNDSDFDKEATSSENDDSFYPVDNNGRSSLKRKYTYHKRKKKTSTSKNRRSQWLSALDSMTQAKLRRMLCCKKLNCFKTVDYEYFIERSRKINSSSPLIRRSLLSSMRCSDNRYLFNGEEVCVRFLRRAFHFSTDLIRSDRLSIVHNSKKIIGENTSEYLQLSISSTSSTKTTNSYRIAPHKDSILSFLIRLSEDCSEKMPDVDELHLPFFQKTEVYDLFVHEYKKLYTTSPPTAHYFMFTWKENCRQVKVRKTSRFTICDECDKIRVGMRDALLKGKSLDAWRSRRATHMNTISDERLEYQKKRDRARLDPSKFCSIIVDGADQSAFGLPHFTTTTKDVKGLALKVKVVGVLEHLVENNLHLFTMTQEHSTGANHIVETIHRFLQDRRARGALPPKFFVQLDNCTRENKNHYLMAYLQSLVALGVFDFVEAGFLPKGHTHEDVDQCFSQTSGRLRKNDAITLSDLQSQLAMANKGRAKVNHMRRLVNWSGLCDQEGCLQRLENISQYRYFKFSRSYTESNNSVHGPFSTTCHVKHNCYESWRPLIKGKRKTNEDGFLKFCPDIRRTPPLQIRCPDDKEKVSSRFISEESRINDTDKMIDLQKLRDFVFQDRLDDFHWDLTFAIETQQQRLRDQQLTEHNEDEITVVNVNERALATATQDYGIGRGGDSSPRTKVAAQSEDPANKFNYVKNTFVAVRSDETSSSTQNQKKSFWIAKVMDSEKEDDESFARKLKIHWYNATDEDEPLYTSYYPYYMVKSQRRKGLKSRKYTRQELNIPMIDTIDTDTVLVSFDSLTTKRTLPISVQKKLST